MAATFIFSPSPCYNYFAAESPTSCTPLLLHRCDALALLVIDFFCCLACECISAVHVLSHCPVIGYRHCATHQIRVILISCVVITSLFYPALDVYTSSRTSSQSIIDAWLSPTSAPLTAEHDLVDLWSGQDGLHIHKDPVTRAKCNNGQALRVERLLIQSPLVEDDGALNHKILLSTYNLERRIQQLASVGESPCLRITGGQCLVISPLAFWDYDQNALGSDANIFDTLSYSRNISISGIPVTPHMVLAGRGSYGSYEPHVGGGNKFDYATYLVLTFFFPRNACWGPASEHSRWVNTIRNAVGDRGEVDTQMAEAILIALEVPNHNLIVYTVLILLCPIARPR